MSGAEGIEASGRVRRQVALVALCLAALVAAWFVLPEPSARSSTLSRADDGWWAMRAYLEARGAEVHLLDGPLGDGTEAPGGVLVLAFPWQRPPQVDLERHLRDHLRAGGDVLVAYDGASADFLQEQALGSLGLDPLLPVRDAPPLAPRAWWRHRRQRWSPEPVAGGPALELPAFHYAPHPPQDAEVLYTRPGDLATPLVFRFPRHAGEVLVMPTSLFANSEVASGENLQFLEQLLARYGPRFVVDEYHHGLVRAELAVRSSASHAFDLFVIHLLLIYALAVLAAGRRFGPPWRETRHHAGSTLDFLRNLGVLHHQLGHHRAAAEQLVARSRRLAGGGPVLDVSADDVETGRDLVRLANALADPDRPSPPPARGARP